MMLCGKNFALVRSVTSLTGAFAGNFVDFQSDFFHVSSYSQLSLWATLNEDSIVQAIVFGQRDVVHVKSKFKTVRQPQLHT